MTFDRIYRSNAWNGIESRSGPGSGTAATRGITSAIVSLVEELGIRSVLDVGCGDGFWIPALPGYYGIDASREAVRLARRKHPGRRYGTTMPAESFDLVIMRDVIQHLPLDDGMRLVLAAQATGSKWLLASTFRGGSNVDIVPGDAYSPDMEAAPFSLPHPTELIFDGYAYAGTFEVRDPRKFLGLWPL